MHELCNDYPLFPDKLVIKKEILFDYQLKIADFYNSPLDFLKILVPNFFGQEM